MSWVKSKTASENFIFSWEGDSENIIESDMESLQEPEEAHNPDSTTVGSMSVSNLSIEVLLNCKLDILNDEISPLLRISNTS